MAIKPFNSVAGFSVGETPANIILANGDITTTNITTTGVSNLNSISNVKISGGSSGQFITTDGAGNLSFATVDAATLSNGNSNIRILANANIVFSSAGNANVLTITGVGANIDGGLGVTGNISANGVLTDNLYYANGQPWDLQQPAGSNTYIQYNDNGSFGASANFTYNDGSQQFYVNGTANITGNATINNDVFIESGNIAGLNGQRVQLYSTDYVQLNYNDDVYVYTQNNGVWLETNGGGNLNLGTDGNVSMSGNLAVTGNIANANNITATNDIGAGGNVSALGVKTDNLYYANGTPWDFAQPAGANTEIQYNDGLGGFGASNNFTFDAVSNQFYVNGNANVTGTTKTNQIQHTGMLTNQIAFANGSSYLVGTNNFTFNENTNEFTVNGNAQFNNANLGNLATASYVNVSQTLSGNVANFSGNLSASNANLGNLVEANYVNVSQTLNGNVANFSGNLTSLNANLGNLATANYVNVANDLNVTGNINAATINSGGISNGTSNVRVFQNANVTFSSNGVANIAQISDTGLYVAGEINSTSGNILANGSVTANGFLNGANANVTGQAELGSVLTANITAPSGNLTLSAAGSDQNIYLVPTGNGVVDVAQHLISQVANPVNPADAATKEYVDSIAQGLSVHPAVRVTSLTNLNATYTAGGTALTTTTISGGTTITFSANHGLSVGDEIYWSNSFNGIIANDSYFVYSTPALNQITVKAGFYGAQVTTLTNGTGLSQAARANSGVGATLTNAGANAALSIDSVALSTTNRVLVQGQTNSVQNGVYTVTTVGDGSTAWVLTRATGEDTYDPKSTTGLSYGDYFFVTSGTNAAGSSYVVSSPVGEIVFGVTSIGFTQFSASGSYTAGNGIAINGTIISANVDLDTTDIVGGNIVVKSGANLVTPNIGDATFSSLTWNTLSNGNVSANNLSISNIANITLDLTVGGNIQANGTISSNANVSGLNFTTNGNVEAGGNVLAANITANSTIFASNANISGTTITDALTVNNAISGNTANFTGNLVAGNLSTTGSGGNITGANVISANTFTGNINGNTANFSGNIDVGGILTDNYYYANGNPVDFQQPAGSNTQIQYNDNDSFGASANFTYNDSTQVLLVNGTANVTTANISGNINVGNSTINTAITWGSLTTSSITANQTIASFSVSGVTGVEFLVKGIDSTGSKYSVATVIAVTDGSNVDYSTFGTVNLGGYLGSLAVNVSGGSIRLQVTPSSSNSTVWTTQYRVI